MRIIMRGYIDAPTQLLEAPYEIGTEWDWAQEYIPGVSNKLFEWARIGLLVRAKTKAIAVTASGLAALQVTPCANKADLIGWIEQHIPRGSYKIRNGAKRYLSPLERENLAAVQAEYRVVENGLVDKVYDNPGEALVEAFRQNWHLRVESVEKDNVRLRVRGYMTEICWDGKTWHAHRTVSEMLATYSKYCAKLKARIVVISRK
ncbi:hypothetical protein [Methylobacterium sp. Leaf118]|uniref:hypothetical protein n=1 Tax=Methylobacterium sp. Leaf118 TaxID=2876562 RepID=UPI001E3AD40E|nr:hypothetical protein [Methylobacterium sp. Leaf118]